MLASGIFIIINQKVHLLFYQDSSVEFCWNWASGSGEEDFRNSVNEFRYLFGKSRGPSLKQAWRFMFCAKYGWDWSSGSGEED